MRALMMSGVSVGSFCVISAAAPATIGVAMLVPLRRKYFPLLPVMHSPRTQVVVGEITRFEFWVARVLPGASRETIRLPGATRSGLTTWSRSVGPLEL